MSFEQALGELSRTFGDYIKDKVLTKAKIGQLGIIFASRTIFNNL